MKRVIADVETDGFLEELTIIHCLVIRDLDSDTVVSCSNDPRWTGPSIEEGLAILAAAERIYGHNLVTFDMPAIKKVYPNFTTKAELRDTYLIAQMRWAHIKPQDFEKAKKGLFPANLAGLHTLEAWGHRLGCPKVDYKKWCADNGIAEPFAEWRLEMQTYCEADTDTTKRLVELIRSSDVSPESVEIETELAEYLGYQMRAGWPFDMKKAVALVADLTAKREVAAQELVDHFGGWFVNMGEFTPKVNNKAQGYVKGAMCSKLKYIEFNPSSRDHIANRLTALYGWKADTFTDGGKPQVEAGMLKGLAKKHEIVKDIIEYLLTAERLEMISEGKQAWLKHATDLAPEGGRITGMHHVHPRIKQNHAVTHRASAASPPIHGTPKITKPYGPECRELFRVPDGWWQLGSDISGLELRNLAHYLGKYDNGAFTKVLLEGDPHKEAQKLLLEFVGEGEKGRDTSKTFRYAYLYGGGDGKLGSILAPTASESKQKTVGAKGRALFINGTPGLKYLTDALEKARVSKGYILMPDGRRAYVRHKHAVLNTLLQGAGAIISKRWIIDYARVFYREFGVPGWRGNWVPLGWSHDETQSGWRIKAEAEAASGILVQTIRNVGNHFEWRCPLDGTAKIGLNWKECH